MAKIYEVFVNNTDGVQQSCGVRASRAGGNRASRAGGDRSIDIHLDPSTIMTEEAGEVFPTSEANHH